MNRILLLLTLFLFASITLGLAQSEPGLGKSNTFAILGSSYLSNTGVTGVTGDVGLSPQGVFTDNGELLVKGSRALGLPLATEALRDARIVHDYWLTQPATPFSSASLKAGGSFPGIYRSSGNVNVDGVIVLDGKGDVNAKFVFIIDGDLTTPEPLPPTPSSGLLLQNGAQAKNIFWIVKGKVRLGSSTSFQGTIISLGDIWLGQGTNLIGRAISLDGGISLNNNNIFLPNVIIADLNIAKVAPKGEYTIGDEITYTITVRNEGPGTATRVVVTELIPPALEFVRVESISAGAYDPANREWIIDELKLSESAVLKLTFKIVSAGSIKNKVKVGSNNPDPDPGNNEGEEPIIVPVIAADLSVTKTASGAPYQVGGTVTYTIVAKNDGPYPAENVIVNESLPNTLELISFDVTKGSYNPVTGKYTVGTLAKGETATLTLVAKIKGAGLIRNTASVSTSTKDPEPGNNTDIEIIEVTCPVPTLVLTGSATQCAESTNVTYTVTEVIGATYTFELTGGLTEVSRSGNSITVNVGNASGKIKATVKDLCGGTYTVEKDITVTTQPIAPSISGNTTVCINSNDLTYTAEGPGQGLTYEWTATGDVQVVGNTDSKSVKVNVGVNGGTLSVKASNECFTSQTATITISTKTAPDAPTTITGDKALCVGSEVSYTIPASDGATGYTWTVPSGWEIIGNPNTVKLTVKVGTTGGNITVTAKNECGNSAAASLAVTVKDKPETPGSINGTVNACLGKTGLTYTIEPVAGAKTYNWNVPAGWEIVDGLGTNTIIVKAGTTGGNITVTAENECGISAPATLALTISQTPNAPLVIEGNDKICAGVSQTYKISDVTGATEYNWSVPTGWVIKDGQGKNTITVTPGTDSGSITVTASNACGTSSATSKPVVVDTPPTTPTFISGPTATCGNTSGLIYTIKPVDRATGYTWKVPTGWVIESGHGTVSIRVKAGSNSGDVTVTADNDCGSSTAAVYTVTVSNIPLAPAKINGDAAPCLGVKATYSIDVVEGATGYTWTVPTGWTIKDGQGSSSIEVEPGSNGGQITVAVTNQCGTSDTAKLDVSSVPAPATPGTIDGPNATCANTQNLTYSITVLTAGDTYTWTVPTGWTIVSGQGTQSIKVNAGSDSGQVSVTSSNKCSTSTASTLNVNVTTPPAAPAFVKDMSTLCDGLMYTIDAVTGSTSYTWTVPAGFTIVSGQGTTTIKVKVDDPNAFGDVSVTANNGDCASPIVSIPIDKTLIEGDLNFPKAFSPNGDGKNDTWVISNITKYPKNQVVIFNRWGSEVYKKNNYQNDWNGNKLEPGTYFYKVNVTMCDGADKVFTGYVTIFR